MTERGGSSPESLIGPASDQNDWPPARVAARISVTKVHTGRFLEIPPTRATIQVDQALFARIEDGRVDELWEIVDTGSGLRQLGVLRDQALGLDED